MKHVYFLKPVGMAGPVKIGCSVDPVKRLRAYAIWSPFELELIAAVPGENEHEHALHIMFYKQRVHGEWFEYSQALGDLIAGVVERGALPPLEIPSGQDYAASVRRDRGKLPRRISADWYVLNEATRPGALQ